ncbi:major capsid protein [Gorillibacterium sp. sgz5001074]|uniref:major capsid protein n=1 Tax=Gorillibacterium sp. sgz5001074 TaxID=3446695 RepID=UPI003F679509
MNIYKTKTMLQAIDLKKPVRGFFRETFFPGFETFVTEEVYVDYRKGKRKMAPVVANNRVGGITMDRQGYRTDIIKAPKIAPQRQLTVDDISVRGMGEAVFSTRTPAQRQVELLAKDLTDLDEMIYRREEWMLRELLFKGVINLKGYIDRNNSQFVEQNIDYNFTNKIVLAGGALWNAETSTILGNLKQWTLNIIQATGYAPEMVILGQNAANEFLADSDIGEKLKMFNAALLELRPRVINPALTYIGRIAELGLDIYTYNEWFLDDDGNEYPMVPVDHILLGRPNIGKVLYGSITQLEQGQFVTYESTRVPKQWADDENEQLMLRLSARPVPQPTDVDSWLVAKVL